MAVRMTRSGSGPPPGDLPSSRDRHTVSSGLDRGEDGVALVYGDPQGGVGEGDGEDLSVCGVAAEAARVRLAVRVGDRGPAVDRLQGGVEPGEGRGTGRRRADDLAERVLIDDTGCVGLGGLLDWLVGLAGTLPGRVVPGVFGEDPLGNATESSGIGDRCGEFPHRRLARGRLGEVCHWLFSCLGSRVHRGLWSSITTSNN